ncbi:unnamed protein product [Effrenium voratum]|uniref:Kinesin motor domain-containing protein n=1 Tax=Effrenium voratum TaxID=2562239 RepID=A0AA36IK96_9DINO|nr:unnamed protein product [Effrenium voratum]
MCRHGTVHVQGLRVTCISPALAFAEESVNSLNYAQKAMNIQNTPVLQLDEQQRVLHELRSENAQLRKELEGYKQAATLGLSSPREAAASVAGSDILEASPASAITSDAALSASRGRSLPPDFAPQAGRKRRDFSRVSSVLGWTERLAKTGLVI